MSTCASREGTAASHCWHDVGFGGGGISQGTGRAVSLNVIGTRVCCYCGVRKRYEHSFSAPLAEHGPYHPNRSLSR